MNPDLQAKFNSICAYPFFETVGAPLPNAVATVSGWPLATKHCFSRKWTNCRLVARNTLFDVLQRRSWERGVKDLETLSKELAPLVNDFVDLLLPKTSLPDDLVEKVKPRVAWDIYFICVEYEYRDLVEPLFYISCLDHWYAAGHFPCGWDGKEFPEDWEGIRIARIYEKSGTAWYKGFAEDWNRIKSSGRLIVF